MKVRLRGELEGMRIDETVEGRTPEAVVIALRDRVAKRIPHIPFTRKDDQMREQLDVDGKGDWTPSEFRAFVVEYYNKELKPRMAPMVNVPGNDAEFIGLGVRIGLLKIVEA